MAQAKMTREEYKRHQELLEQRKAGTAAPQQDEEGNDINPHISQYIADAPWYLAASGPGLKHQRYEAKTYAGINDTYQRGIRAGPAATKFRKGACDNCGAMTHKKKDCMERPRTLGAKHTGKNIQADEVVQPDLALDFDGKRDRWAGYDAKEYDRVVRHHEKMEQARRQLKEKKLQDELETKASSGNGMLNTVDEAMVGSKSSVRADSVTQDTAPKDQRSVLAITALAADSDDDDDGDGGGAEDEEEEKGYAEQASMPGQKFDEKRRQTVRNLRIREDTAKYLLNLDLDSAHYDPKTRSMRAAPSTNSDFMGDNFMRHTGDTIGLAEKQIFAWQASDRGVDLNLLADPTKAELLHREFEKKKDSKESTVRSSILDKYGGTEHLEAPPKALLLAQSEDYVEYSRTGKVIRGQEKAVTKSRYLEDEHPGNHTSTWGSYWEQGRWGYHCCFQLSRSAYCTGAAGKEARRQRMVVLSRSLNTSEASTDSSNKKSLVDLHKDLLKDGKKKDKKGTRDFIDDINERNGKVDSGKLKAALKAQRLDELASERLADMDERKRAYNSLSTETFAEPSREEMEAWRMKRTRHDDPMAKFL